MRHIKIPINNTIKTKRNYYFNRVIDLLINEYLLIQREYYIFTILPIHEKNIVYELQKIKDQVEFSLNTKKGQTVLDAYFDKELVL